MTTVKSTQQLTELVGDAEAFLADAWGVRTATFRCPAVPALLSAPEIWDAFDCGLLVAPYFSVARDGVSAPAADISVTRKVLQKPRARYANGAGVRKWFAAGYTVCLRQPDHWHAGLKELVGALREELRADVRSSVFLSPPPAQDDAQGGTPVRTEAHLFALQLEGETRWSVGDEGRRTQTALTPGSVLYLPPGHEHTVAAHQGNALYLTLSVRRPSPRDLAEVALAGFLKSAPAEAIAGTHHYLSLEEKVSWLRRELTAHLAGQDIDDLLATAVGIHQRAGQA
ncbi:JmjC domain-containing protein [Streptomyces sp. TLI_185]|uniref:JmjC domain-containing protein n=1 Tax=Streptomyces sp. TLI_185 TaxID=2485151 RepID=UPI000F4F73E3|nr:cupin domain-containing protein [Streptomyces sp. TLI_185]RPF24866.1 cupin superfamily protein [Streptomyces sp. TLI_185]